MKYLGDMNHAEIEAFMQLAARISCAVLDDRSVELVEPVDKAAITAWWVKSAGRPMLNVWTEYSIDPAAFVDDAAKIADIFLANMQDLMVTRMTDRIRSVAEAEGIDIEHAKAMVEQHRSLLRTKAYRPVMRLTFERLFHTCREQGML